MKNQLFILVLTVSLVSCGLPLTGYKEFKPAEGEPAANIKFVSLVGGNVSVSMLNEARCDHSGFGYEALSLTTLFGLEDDVVVRADRQLHVRISGSQLAAIDHGVASYSGCRTRFSFMPSKGNNYKVTFVAKGDGCHGIVTRLVTSGSKTQEIKEASARQECEGLYDKF